MRARHGAIVGRTGSGKSQLIKTGVKWKRFGSRLIILDYTGEYAAERVLVPGLTVEQMLDELEEKTPICFEFDVIPLNAIIPDSGGEIEAQLQTDITDICNTAMIVRENTLICEEVSAYKDNPGLINAILRGRRQMVRIIAVSQRPALVSPTVRDSVVWRIYFQTSEPRNLKAIGEAESKEVAEAVHTLGQYHIVLAGDVSECMETFGSILEIQSQNEEFATAKVTLNPYPKGAKKS